MLAAESLKAQLVGITAAEWSELWLVDSLYLQFPAQSYREEEPHLYLVKFTSKYTVT